MRDIETYVRVPIDRNPNNPFTYSVVRTHIEARTWLVFDDDGGYDLYEAFNGWDESQWVKL